VKERKKLKGKVNRGGRDWGEAVAVFEVSCYGTWRHAVAHLVEALRYNPEGRRFDSRWCHMNVSLTQSFRLHYGPRVYSASNRNEYQEYFRGDKGGWCVGLTTLPPSCVDLFLNLVASNSGTLRVCRGIALRLLQYLAVQFIVAVSLVCIYLKCYCWE
jgi:hypothetical protein